VAWAIRAIAERLGGLNRRAVFIRLALWSEDQFINRLDEALDDFVLDRDAVGQVQFQQCQEGLIVGADGEAHWGKFDPDTIYIVLQDGRNVPVQLKRKGKF
jgi:hypothetical protein